MLFNLVGDGLARMIDKSVGRGLIQGVLGDFRRGGLTCITAICR